MKRKNKYKEKIETRNTIIFMLLWILIGLWFGLFLGIKFMLGYFTSIAMAFVTYLIMSRFELIEDE